MATAEQKKSTPVLLWVAGVLVVVLLVFAVRWLTRETLEVRVGHVSRQTLESTVSTNGKVEPIAGFQAHAPAPGVVEKIPVTIGQQVSAGQLLVQMDDTDARARLASAEATLTTAHSSLADIQHGGSSQERNRFSSDISAARMEQQQAQANLATEERLQQQGAASAGEVAVARQRLESAQLSLTSSSQRASTRYDTGDRASAVSRIADARAAIAAARNSLAEVTIRSPLAGTVYSIPVAQYDFVQAGETLLDVADLNRIQVRAYFDEPEIGKLAAGQSVTIVWDARPGRVWHGHIERAPTTVITYGTRSVGESLITVDDAHGDLLPNTNVTVTVIELQRPNVLSIPREALHTESGHDYVFRVAGGTLVRTPIQVGVVTLNNVELLKGLKEGDTVALGSSVSGKDLSNKLKVTTVQ